MATKETAVHYLDPLRLCSCPTWEFRATAWEEGAVPVLFWKRDRRIERMERERRRKDREGERGEQRWSVVIDPDSFVGGIVRRRGRQVRTR